MHSKTLVRFQIRYFILALLLFITEVLIALFAHDRIIRPYVGDLLVVILIYCFVKTFLDSRVIPTAIAVLVFAYAVEISQYFHLINLLGLEHSTLARIILGTSFEWVDLLAYTIGIATVIFLEQFFQKKSHS